MSEAEKCKLCGVKKISHYGPGPRQRLGLYCYGSCHELREQVYEPAEPSPAPQAEQSVCKWCGAAIKPWTDRYVDMAGGELCQDGGQEQFARRHSPAERVIEVAPQEVIQHWATSSIGGRGRGRYNCACGFGRASGISYEAFQRHYIIELESALTAARKEIDRLKEVVK